MEKNGHVHDGYRFLSFKEVQQLTGLSRSTIYRQVRRGDFPRPRTISERKVGFLETDLERWFKERGFAPTAVDEI